MATHIFDASGRFISEGKNLRIVIAHAKKRGVARISATPIESKFYTLLVRMTYSDGSYAVYNFADASLCAKFHEKRWPGKFMW